jgi:UDP-N-acetylglucosamine 2-epimerase (non-hydrolysing)
VVVVGDVNSTLAAALAAAKLTIPVAHVEAGLRSRDWTMPEEINRVLTDRLSDWLFTPSPDADANLLREGIEEKRIHLVGNVMIDSLTRLLPRARTRSERLRSELGLQQRYAVATAHRPGNVDEEANLLRLLDALADVARRLPVVFPVHPRTRDRIHNLGFLPPESLKLTEPLGYLDFLSLLSGSALALTDSGGVQEETSVLGIPCLTLRPNTERPITCEIGTNRVVGTDPATVVTAAYQALDQEWHPAQIPLWDGHSAERIAAVLLRDLT